MRLTVTLIFYKCLMRIFQPSFQPFDYGAVPPTPIYNIQQGANGELYAEPDPSMSFHPSQVV